MEQANLARNLRVLRAERGLNIKEASKLSGVTQETISSLEHGQRGAYTSTLYKLAAAYGVTVGDILSGEIGLLTASKAEAPQAGQVAPVPTSKGIPLSEKALNAARADAAKSQKATNRLFASEGTLPATNVSHFEEDDFRAQLRELGFPDEFFETLLWPLVQRVVELENPRLLQAWRAFVWQVERRWEKDPPQTSRETAVVLDTMRALIDQGVFEHLTDAEGAERQGLLLGLRRLNEIADGVERDKAAEQRRGAFELIQGLVPA